MFEFIAIGVLLYMMLKLTVWLLRGVVLAILFGLVLLCIFGMAGLGGCSQHPQHQGVEYDADKAYWAWLETCPRGSMLEWHAVDDKDRGTVFMVMCVPAPTKGELL
jgi:hypothetical protein